MKLDGMHHITMITGDAVKNVDFYAPDAYHLYFGDEQGSPGSILTWFEFAGVPKGRAGTGMIHTIQLGVASEEALDFWAARLASKGYASDRGQGSVTFEDYDGLRFELVIAADGNPPLRAQHPEVPAEHAIRGVEGARAYARRDVTADRELLTGTLGFAEEGDGRYRLQGDERHFHWAYDAPPSERPLQGAGTVHHIAWHSRD